MEHSTPTRLAFSTTVHCLVGCGLGDVAGFVAGTAIGAGYYYSILIGIIAGFILGYIFGIYPLIKSRIDILEATKIVLTTETLSILVMEAGETFIELIFPGMKRAGLFHVTYWLGLSSALFFGFVVAYPVNYLLVKRGVRHHH